MLWLGIIFIALGAILSLANWLTLYSSWATGKYSSPVPFIGGFLLAGGLACVHAHGYWGFAVLADYGTLVGILGLPFLLRELWSTASFNRLHLFRVHDGQRTIEVSLYRRGIAVIKINFDPPAPADEQGVRLVSSGQVGKWQQMADLFEIRIPDRHRVLILKPGQNDFVCEDIIPSSEASSAEHLNGLRMSKC